VQDWIWITNRARPTTRSYLHHRATEQPIAGYRNPIHIQSSAQAYIAVQRTPTYEGGFSVLSQLILLRPFWDVLPRFERTSLSSGEKPVSGVWVAMSCESYKPKNADILKGHLMGLALPPSQAAPLEPPINGSCRPASPGTTIIGVQNARW